MPSADPGSYSSSQDLLARSNSSYESLGKKNLIIIVGPTAVGKTEIAIQLAERLKAEIISADSRLFYRGMNVGTAKPSPADLARVPHHLIDVADPDEVWSLALFQQAAHRSIAQIHARHRLPILVGGTGQYIRAVIQSWKVPIVAPDLRLRFALEHWAKEIGPQGLHARLTVLDPEAASQIDYRNQRRTIRALEVILRSGQRFSSQRQQSQSPYRNLQLGLSLPRPDLFARIDTRIDAMISSGLIEEVQGLIAKGYSPDLPTMTAIGYQEISAYLAGKMDLDQAIAVMKRRTRQLVRRQANWFKLDDPSIHWFEVNPATIDNMELYIRGWLAEDWGMKFRKF